MKRRTFIAGLGATAAWPVVARAQQPVVPVIGFLSTGSPGLLSERLRAFHRGLGETGFVEGQNVAVEYRWVGDQYERLPVLAAELVGRTVAVMVAVSNNTAVAARAATAVTPIVFAVGVDPVAAGLVVSLNRPGNNLTGVVTLNDEVAPKWLELLHEVVPTATIMAVLTNPTNVNAETQTKKLQAAARALGLQLRVLHAGTEREIDTAFAELAQLRPPGFVISGDAIYNNWSEQLAALSLRHAIPAIYQNPAFAAAGGLMSYGGSYMDSFRVVGAYAGRILKGEKPADLPVQQVTKLHLVINLKTAKALGLTVPPSILLRADEVIE
jgi:putative ABC transport system substrate-binding protein